VEDVTVSAVAVTTTSDEHATARFFFVRPQTERDVMLPTDGCVRSEPGLEFARGGCSRQDVKTTPQLHSCAE